MSGRAGAWRMTGSAEKCPWTRTKWNVLFLSGAVALATRGVVRGEWQNIGPRRSLADSAGCSKSMCFTMVLDTFSKNSIQKSLLTSRGFQGPQNRQKMVPRWCQDGVKMALRWPMWGQDGSKMGNLARFGQQLGDFC